MHCGLGHITKGKKEWNRKGEPWKNARKWEHLPLCHRCFTLNSSVPPSCLPPPNALGRVCLMARLLQPRVWCRTIHTPYPFCCFHVPHHDNTCPLFSCCFHVLHHDRKNKIAVYMCCITTKKITYTCCFHVLHNDNTCPLSTSSGALGGARWLLCFRPWWCSKVWIGT